jgi:hypothetical protein
VPQVQSVKQIVVLHLLLENIFHEKIAGITDVTLIPGGN